MYSIIFSSSSKKDLKKLPTKIVFYIKDQFLTKFKLNPHIGEKLHGVFKNYWKIKFRIKSVDYRIIYQIFKNKLFVYIVLIGTRENIYKELKRRTK